MQPRGSPQGAPHHHRRVHRRYAVNLLETLIGKLAHRLLQPPGVIGVGENRQFRKSLTTAKSPSAPKPASSLAPSRPPSPTMFRPTPPLPTPRSTDADAERCKRAISSKAPVPRGGPRHRGLFDDRRGDRVMVCLSGGKRQLRPARHPARFRRPAPVRFELIAVNLDQKQPGFLRRGPAQPFGARAWVACFIETQDTYSIVKEKVPRARPQ